MKKLCPSFDLNPPHLSPISTKFPKPTSLLCYTSRISCSNRSTYCKCKVSIPQTSAAKNPTSQVNNNGDFVGFNQDLTRVIGRGFVGFAAALAVCVDSPALAESLPVAFTVSRAHEVNKVQRTLVEAWGLIRETFVDPTFNHQDWDMKLQQTMVEMFLLRSADAAYKKISGIFATLGDPFNRIISPKEY